MQADKTSACHRITSEIRMDAKESKIPKISKIGEGTRMSPGRKSLLADDVLSALYIKVSEVFLTTALPADWEQRDSVDREDIDWFLEVNVKPEFSSYDTDRIRAEIDDVFDGMERFIEEKIVNKS